MGSSWVSRPLVAAAVILLGLGVVGVPAAEASPANITASLSGSPPPPAAGGTTITYTLAVGNSGSSPSGVVTLSDIVGLAYVPNSATCGSVPDCTVQETGALQGCPTFPPTTNIVYCPDETVVTWTITSIAANASDLDLSAQAMSLGSERSNTASWLGDGCTTPGQLTPGLGYVTGGCSTNTVLYSGAYVDVNETLVSPAEGTNAFSQGVAVAPGQHLGYAIGLANTGSTVSGAITVTDSVPVSANATLDPDSPTCGSVPNCTVTDTPSAMCPSGPCAGSLITWVITSIAPGAEGLVLSFSATVNSNASGSVVNQAMWNGPITPPISVPATSAFTSGDGCLYEPPPTAEGCLPPSLTNPVVAATPPAPTPTPITQATTVHTGEPWAGSQPIAGALFGVGVGLMAAGCIQRRRRRA